MPKKPCILFKKSAFSVNCVHYGYVGEKHICSVNGGVPIICQYKGLQVHRPDPGNRKFERYAKER